MRMKAMKRDFADRFNEEVERYRQALLFYARKCDWETFKMKAGNLFDYVEWVELSETERRFFRIFKAILVVLVAVVIAIMNMDWTINPELQRIRFSIVLLAIAGSCFELYFFLNFRTYMEVKTTCYQKRKDRFIRNIENDFRKMVRQTA
jgi:hypothetical protein